MEMVCSIEPSELKAGIDKGPCPTSWSWTLTHRFLLFARSFRSARPSAICSPHWARRSPHIWCSKSSSVWSRCSLVSQSILAWLVSEDFKRNFFSNHLNAWAMLRYGKFVPFNFIEMLFASCKCPFLDLQVYSPLWLELIDLMLSSEASSTWLIVTFSSGSMRFPLMDHSNETCAGCFSLFNWQVIENFLPSAREEVKRSSKLGFNSSSAWYFEKRIKANNKLKYIF